MKLYDKKESCPNCKMEFHTKKPLSSSLRLLRLWDDNYKEYHLGNPLHYEISVCPYCGFAFTDKINQHVTPKHIPVLFDYYYNVKNFSDLIHERDDNQAIKSYLMAIDIATKIKTKDLYIGLLYLKLAWIYRSMEEPDVENAFLKEATTYLKKSYLQDNLELIGADPTKLIYQIAEIYRYLDDYESAKHWYNLLFTRGDKKAYQLRKGRDHWSEYRNYSRISG